MFYKVELKDHIRVPPDHFDREIKDATTLMIKQKYEGYISKELGMVIGVGALKQISEGTVISGDGAGYFDATFELFTFKPDMHEVVYGKIKDIADFGAFITMGPIEGMIHVSQAMDDFVSFSKDKVLMGRDSKRTLKVNDKCKARIIAISYKDMANPKIGLTMRQKGLGRVEWIEEDMNPSKEPKEKEAKEEKKK